MKNYIEVIHEYSFTGDVYDGEDRDIWWAISPTEGDYRMWRKGEAAEPWGEAAEKNRPWKINGELYIGGIEDINGLRKLLDALEEEFSAAEHASGVSNA